MTFCQPQNLAYVRKTSSIFSSHFPNSQIEEFDSFSKKGTTDHSGSTRDLTTNCLDAILATNSSSGSEQYDDIEAKDQSEDTKKLCKFFQKTKYPSKEELQMLSMIINKPIKHLETWFKNKRRALALKGQLPNYQHKNKFTKQEVDILKEFFKNVKKPKKLNFEEILQKLNQKCTIKNIKNWFNHYKKKIRLGIEDKKKKVKIESINDQSKQNSQTLENQANTTESNNVTNFNNYSQIPLQNLQFQNYNQQMNNNNAVFLVPVYQNCQPFSMLQNYRPMFIQNSGLQQNTNGLGQMQCNDSSNSMMNNYILNQNMLQTQNPGYYLIMNQPNYQNLQKVNIAPNNSQGDTLSRTQSRFIPNIPQNCCNQNMYSQSDRSSSQS